MTSINYQCFILPKEALSVFLDFQEKWSLLYKGGCSVYTPIMKRKYVRTLRCTPVVLEYNKSGGLCIPEDGNNIIYELGLADGEESIF